ncbi:DUF6246 family protein [Aquabacterium sp. OR-4]|uniref:DUF6246 family protein n=1 Tax=Aquabacterium sp. OR-4 TaxID=2978127 RepID=UPI0028C927DB|nr:DUF6246 family protein [Aquabacterium sp. OR-4]MDT7834956.1 DUF6246 family protein [Aquabacterium sp. OR-4]
MLVECGFVRAYTSSGAEFTFTPSLGRIADLGSPHEIVALYAALHGSNAAQDAAYVLAGLCDQEDASALIGWHDEAGAWHDGAMPPAERVVIARHLMQHGICGKARPSAAGAERGGQYTDRFEAAEYIAAARVHFGLSSADAAALSMTEFQTMLAMKFLDSDAAKGARRRDVPSRAEYEAAMARVKGKASV